MKRRKQWGLFIAIMLLSLWISSNVMADDVYKAIDLKAGEKVVQKGSEYDSNTGNHMYYRYRIVIPEDGYIKISIYKDTGAPFVYIRKKNDNTSLRFIARSDISEGSNIVPLSKGTYYLNCDEEETGFSYTYTKVSFPANYCRRKAVTLKKGVTVSICQTPKRNYSRWYKIRLTKKQSISFNSSVGNRIRIYNSTLRSMSIEHAGSQSTRYFTQEKLPKGTYYICVKRADPGSYYSSDGYYYTTLSWN